MKRLPYTVVASFDEALPPAVVLVVDDDVDDSALPPAFALVVGFLQVIPLKTAMRPEEDS